jgi:hypothetical protein
MKLKRPAFLLALIFFTLLLHAQTDSLQLTCPLSNGAVRTIRPSDKDYQKTSEYGVMIFSRTDTLVQAVHDGSVVIVKMIDEGRYDVVIQYRGYYFWYAGVQSPKVKTGSKIKSGDPISSYKQGELLELLMFYQEEPLNPRKYLKCK